MAALLLKMPAWLRHIWRGVQQRSLDERGQVYVLSRNEVKHAPWLAVTHGTDTFVLGCTSKEAWQSMVIFVGDSPAQMCLSKATSGQLFLRVCVPANRMCSDYSNVQPQYSVDHVDASDFPGTSDVGMAMVAADDACIRVHAKEGLVCWYAPVLLIPPHEI